MNRAYLFVEGPTDAEFLRRILPPEVLKDVVIVDSRRNDGIPSLARSVLFQRRKPVAVVMAAESLAPDVIEERRGGLEEFIRLANGSTPVKVIAAVPVLEAWLFAAPAAIARMVGGPVPTEFLYLGKRDPQGVLPHLAEKNETKWDFRQAIGLLDDDDIEKIRALPEVRELSTFLQNAQKEDKAA